MRLGEIRRHSTLKARQPLRQTCDFVRAIRRFTMRAFQIAHRETCVRREFTSSEHDHRNERRRNYHKVKHRNEHADDCDDKRNRADSQRFLNPFSGRANVRIADTSVL